MDVIRKIYAKAKTNLKTIVLPESKDERVVEAYEFIRKSGIANAILLSEDKILPQDKERYIQQFYQMRKPKGLDLESARKLFEDPLYYAAMMTREGRADGFVAGASHTTSDVARAAIHCLGVDQRINIACSCFIMEIPNCIYGESGIFFFADCGIVPEPKARQLAYISLATAELAIKVLDFIPRIALLSYSTFGSAKARNVEEIKEALKLLKEMAPDIIAEGELQADAAIVPEVAKIKSPDSVLAGRANVLIFPNLEAGNISYKLLQRLANARATGPLILGLNKPCSDLSRGCSSEDVVNCVAVTAIRAQ